MESFSSAQYIFARMHLTLPSSFFLSVSPRAMREGEREIWWLDGTFLSQLFFTLSSFFFSSFFLQRAHTHFIFWLNLCYVSVLHQPPSHHHRWNIENTCRCCDNDVDSNDIVVSSNDTIQSRTALNLALARSHCLQILLPLTSHIVPPNTKKNTPTADDNKNN